MKKENVNKIIVVGIAIIVCIIVLTFIFSNPTSENEKKETDKIVLEENGEASYLNLSVPNANQKEDSLSLIDKLEKIKNDSLNKSKLNSTGLEEYKGSSIENQKANKEIYQDSKNNRSSANNNKSYNQNTQYSSSFKKKNNEQKAKYKAAAFDDPLEEEKTSTNSSSKVSQESNNNSGFFKSKKETKAVSSKSNNDLNIFACIHTDQTIMNNQRVKFRTTKEFYYNGQKFPINTIIYGLAQIKPNRLIIKINKINQTDIKLEVYDSEDSEEGLYVLTPNLNASLQKELKKESLDDDDISAIPFSKSLKNIFEKKVREEKVQLLNNYKIIIKIKKDE